MQRGTTPTLTFNVPYDLTMASEIDVVFAQHRIPIVVKHKNSSGFKIDPDNHMKFTIDLTENETLRFTRHTDIWVSMRVKIGDRVYRSNVMKMPCSGGAL